MELKMMIYVLERTPFIKYSVLDAFPFPLIVKFFNLKKISSLFLTLSLPLPHSADFYRHSPIPIALDMFHNIYSLHLPSYTIFLLPL